MDILPGELWIEIFSWLNLPGDLCNVSRTCWRFRSFAFRHLHRHLLWYGPRQTWQNLAVWNDHEGMHLVTHTLELGVSFFPYQHIARVNILDVRGQVIRSQPGRRGYHAADAPSYRTLAYHDLLRTTWTSKKLWYLMAERIRSFVHLSTLTLSNLPLSHRHFALIHSLPQLRDLRIESCLAPTHVGAGNYNHANLPITSLALLNIRRCVPPAEGMPVLGENIRCLLKLALARDLRTLRVDATADIFRHVFTLPNFCIPPRLERLYIQRKQLSQPAFAGETTFPDASLHTFLSHAKELTTYSTYHPTPQHQHLLPAALPLLRHYSGPVESIPGILHGRPLVAVQVLHCKSPPVQPAAQSQRDGLSALTNIGQVLPDLEALAVHFTRWDDEIIYAACSLFRNLRRLKIVYESGAPTETMMVIFGPEFLDRLPHLRTLEIYMLNTEQSDKKPTHLFDSTFDSLEDELRNLIVPWQRWCHALREVRLFSRVTMRRGYDGGPWSLRWLSRAEEAEEFL